jgi:hypothetical protein
LPNSLELTKQKDIFNYLSDAVWSLQKAVNIESKLQHSFRLGTTIDEALQENRNGGVAGSSHWTPLFLVSLPGMFQVPLEGCRLPERATRITIPLPANLHKIGLRSD